ncbi:hypothetical protein [Aquimarina sp. I32.4]|uniref:hypothetical protein n=1 Tax=Aquimarina sp. I32.4 TaxID=2053903 RepID=UPI000CDF1596|nr:hypothetical protein [Aquimarina sp. I32.4]
MGFRFFPSEYITSFKTTGLSDKQLLVVVFEAIDELCWRFDSFHKSYSFVVALTGSALEYEIEIRINNGTIDIESRCLEWQLLEYHNNKKNVNRFISTFNTFKDELSTEYIDNELVGYKKVAEFYLSASEYTTSFKVRGLSDEQLLIIADEVAEVLQWESICFDKSDCTFITLTKPSYLSIEEEELTVSIHNSFITIESKYPELESQILEKRKTRKNANQYISTFYTFKKRVPIEYIDNELAVLENITKSLIAIDEKRRINSNI